ncbi:MAG: hypothetical protein A2W91_08555 [Bacteroidetes bacterium GWF2_38_335]|nr:MAG: hypothetical protein A2W91_08555 [Bacteroidetes bacterium GWF2_38_335]OFY80430.1 MAG: hypothetical protein A2281_08280 [Bacteroidetes bacterium RIFOXYA12_FULL_38_20]HBS85971.1 hypothetical protein [Bacteroidales bacterium]
MTKVKLTIITQNQKSREKADHLSDLIQSTLDINVSPIIEKYFKFDNSYKISFDLSSYTQLNLNNNFIEFTDRICSPWVLRYHKNTKNIELFYIKKDSSQIRKNEFNVICCANFEIENE